jgi:hypothetical protein
LTGQEIDASEMKARADAQKKPTAMLPSGLTAVQQPVTVSSPRESHQSRTPS